MKRLLLLFAMCICTTNLFAEGRVFCEIVEYPTAGKNTKVTIDFGQEQRLLSSYQLLADDDGKTLTFNSQIDALNYMESLGWTFTQVYTEVTPTGVSCTHWLLYKEVKAGIDPYEGLQTR